MSTLDIFHVAKRWLWLKYEKKIKNSLIKYLTVFSLFSGDTYAVEEEVVFGRSVKYHQPAPSGSGKRKKKR